MKIAHLISTFLPSIGGAEICVHNLASEQAKRGHYVKVIAPRGGDLPHLDYEVSPLKLKSVFFSMLPFINKLYFVEQLRNYQKRHEFDIWQVTIGYPFGVAAIDFFKKNNIPCILRCSGEDIQMEPEIRYGARLRRWPDFLIRKSYPRFDGCISVSEGITRDYLKIGVSRDKISYIPNGYNKILFDITVRCNYNISHALGVEPDKKIIITIGRNHPKKGFDFIPEIIRILTREGRDDFIWLLIGKGNEAIKRKAQKKGVDKFLITREGVSANDELVKIYKSADLFVLPTLIEGCSTVITEAMASGLPVVSTDVIGVNDMVEHGKTGLLSKKGDLEGMAENIERILDDKGFYERIKKNALARTKNLDWSTIADKYINVYVEVIRKKKR